MADKCTAGVPPAVSGASRPRFGTVEIRDRGRLPHWVSDSACYFVTFRLADSLPNPVLQGFLAERRAIIATAAQLGRDLSSDERKRLAVLFSVKIERYLHTGRGECLLRKDDCAAIVARALQFFHEKRYRLHAWCVMPNHVHAALKMFPGQQLAPALHSWKSFSAHEINKLLGRHGTVWAREYFDHLVRDNVELQRVIQYILNNPIKAGLADWRWYGRDGPTTAGETPAVHV